MRRVISWPSISESVLQKMSSNLRLPSTGHLIEFYMPLVQWCGYEPTGYWTGGLAKSGQSVWSRPAGNSKDYSTWDPEGWRATSASKKEAPISFSNIFNSLLGLAYFTPLGCPVKFKFFFGCLVGPLTLLHPKMAPLSSQKKFNFSGHPKGLK